MNNNTKNTLINIGIIIGKALTLVTTGLIGTIILIALIFGFANICKGDEVGFAPTILIDDRPAIATPYAPLSVARDINYAIRVTIDAQGFPTVILWESKRGEVGRASLPHRVIRHTDGTIAVPITVVDNVYAVTLTALQAVIIVKDGRIADVRNGVLVAESTKGIETFAVTMRKEVR